MNQPPQYPPPGPFGPQGPQGPPQFFAPPPPKRPFFKRGWVKGTGIAFLAFSFGAVAAAPSSTIDAAPASSTLQAAPAPAVTITETAEPAPAVTVTADAAAAPTVTATATITKTAKPLPAKTVTKTVVKTVEAEPEAGDLITDGTWVIGEDVKPGTYKVTEAITSGMCYWKIARSGTNGSNIIENDIVQGGLPVVTLKVGQDFETNECGDWARR